MRKGIRWNPLGPGGDWHATGTQVACMDSDKLLAAGTRREVGDERDPDRSHAVDGDDLLPLRSARE
jgi:hypothetical protein